jgi:DNA-binding NtrC family response regulator
VLRTLEEQEVRRIGSNEVVKVDVRIIAASNRNLAEWVEEGKFRQDLYYRLRVIEIDIPPLRERLDDIPLLVEHFLKKMGREREHALSISPQALSVLMSYSWPGNVRELENALESAVALNRTGVIVPEDLPDKVRTETHEIKRLEDFYAELPSWKRWSGATWRTSQGDRRQQGENLGNPGDRPPHAVPQGGEVQVAGLRKSGTKGKLDYSESGPSQGTNLESPGHRMGRGADLIRGRGKLVAGRLLR